VLNAGYDVIFSNFYLQALRQLGALCLAMLHRASLVPSSDRGWIIATFCITACETRASRGYRECRILLHELFAKLHDANITQPSFLRISIGYRCVAESTTRLSSSVIKPSNCSNLRILLVFSRHTDSRVFWSHVRQAYFQHTLHRQTWLLVGSYAAPPPFRTVFPICMHCW